MTPMHSHPSTLTELDAALPDIQEILRTLTFGAGLNTNLVILGTMLLGIASGVVGVFALLRRRSLVADAVSHATLPGIAIAFLAVTWLGSGGLGSGGLGSGAFGLDGLGIDARSLPVLLTGAALSGVLSIFCIQGILRFSRLTEDAAIGLVLSVFFGAGVVLLSYIQQHASGSAAGINKFIYGQTAAMSRADAMLMGGIAIVSLAATMLMLKELATVCFNDAFARTMGWRVSLIDGLMLSLVVLVTVAGLQAVGIVLVVAMLVIPPVSARFWTERLWLLVLLAGLFGGLSGYLGSVISALLPRKPAGAIIVLTSGVLFTLSFLFAPSRGLFAGFLRRSLFRLKIAADHTLELAVDRAHNNAARVTTSIINELSQLRRWPVWRPYTVRFWLAAHSNIDRTGTLTPKGIQRGERVRRNHQLWERYLITHADIAPSHVDWSVDQVEHVLSPSLIAELEAQLALSGEESTTHSTRSPAGGP